MGSFDSKSPHALDDEQIERLAAIVVEDFGPNLHRTQFNDVILMLFEDIAGFELMTQHQQHTRTCVQCGSSTAGSSPQPARTEQSFRRFNPPWNGARPVPNLYHSSLTGGVHC
jgi:hypothetical protein